MLKLMTPGPTQVRENVRLARSLAVGNPDMDPAFFSFYQETCQALAKLLHTKNPVYILSGEGILGLEAACASLTEPGDRVLVIDNGIFGRGFADFVSLYGGQPVLLTTDERRPVDPAQLQRFLAEDHEFKYATLVHCDTPSGVLNPVAELCPLLQQYGILTVVDSVSGMFGNPLDTDSAGIDILCGGSQKALSAPPGLTFLAVSATACRAMEARQTPIASFYGNILAYRDCLNRQAFPYTPPTSDIYGLRQAVDNIIAEPDILDRHRRIAAACRQALSAGGLQLFLADGFSATVSVFEVPAGLTDRAIRQLMEDRHGIMIADCFDRLAGKVMRIGHMGENANVADMSETMVALQHTLSALGFALQADLNAVFLQAVEA